jgi:hypothetical protein
MGCLRVFLTGFGEFTHYYIIKGIGRIGLISRIGRISSIGSRSSRMVLKKNAYRDNYFCYIFAYYDNYFYFCADK